MKRDMDLARMILLEVESRPFKPRFTELHLEGYSREEVAYHVMLLNDAKLITAWNVDTLNHWVPGDLTWAGHEFLDAARDDKRWEKAKVVMAQVGGFVFEVGKQLLISYMKTELHLS